MQNAFAAHGYRLPLTYRTDRRHGWVTRRPLRQLMLRAATTASTKVHNSTMRPPECAICGLRFEPRESGDAVAFARTDDDERWHQRDDAVPDHPPNVEWFCADHLARARKLRGLPLGEALRRWSDSK